MTAIVKGSLGAISNSSNTPLAESFLNVDALLLVDISGSMMESDVPREGQKVKRWDEAKRQMEMLQASLPGRIALVAFGDSAFFCPDGNLPGVQGCTDMVAALQFIKVVDNCGVRLVLISDGEPNNPSATLKLAAQFKSKIDTIHIGSPRDSSGREFLRKLAALTGGVVVESSSQVLPALAEGVRKLIGA